MSIQLLYWIQNWPQIEEVLVGVVESTLGGADVNKALSDASAKIDAINSGN